MNDAVSENLKRIRYEIEEAKAKYRSPDDTVRLMAVTKTVPFETVNEVIREGVDLLGENRVQEYLEKKDNYLETAEVHFIGHLQTNKVKYIIGSVKCIHSVDSLKLASEIDRLSKKQGITTDILAEVNIGREESKSGVLPEALPELVSGISELESVRLRGLMAIPPAGDISSAERYFDEMHGIFLRLKAENVNADILSMGMSADYVCAVKHGSNIVRIGSALFGARTRK